ncbi:hypothetical protein PGTUg99_024248 [Puccinia graminis f. sp. tritici]|uniref:Uncharacterized protein n=1 Tax=Puccinia graminis f. sp. tritici TaxID=56615 RepID=A0A5B0NJ64_PUCGR|nr:hypothetical protein PGTUg99_024248 [Puccinia graminis f. sp. tritici]
MKTSHLSWSCLRQPHASLRPHPLHRPPSALLRPGPSEPNVHRSAPDFLASSRSAWTSLLHRRPSSSSSHHQVHPPSSSAKASDHQRRFKSFFLSPKAVNLLLWHPEFPGTLLTKRILGLEGDIIKPAKTQNNIPGRFNNYL